jgi:hypothetical protein
MLAVSAAAAAAERPASHTEGTCACPKCHMGRSTRGPFLGADFSALLGSQCWPTSPAVLQGLLGCWLVLARGWLLCHRLLRVLPAQFGGGAGACGATLSCTGTPWHGLCRPPLICNHSLPRDPTANSLHVADHRHASVPTRFGRDALPAGKARPVAACSHVLQGA